jgi:HD domain-containing protein
VLSFRLAPFDTRHGPAPVVKSRGSIGVSREGRRVSPAAKQWAQVLGATLLVAGCPVAVVWWLRASSTITSPVLGIALGMALSLLASQLGRVLWEKRPGSEDLLFSELMLWGYLHRRYTERRLASARDMLAPISDGRGGTLAGLSAKEQAALLERLVGGIETRDPYLHGHSRRVARHSWMIARRMGLSSAEVARIRTAAAIHDVGKVKTPKTVLHKAAPLTPEEYEVIKRHPGEGARMAEVLGDADLASLVRHHHERLDGTGYPNGLSGEQIPLGARIIAVADTFDAITSARPYRAASPHKRALDILRAESGTRLDPAVVQAFCGHYAGRVPIALWATITGLPERALSWIGGSAGSVASAVKVVAVAAVVGGTAVTSSTFALPLPHKHSSTSVQRGSSAVRQVSAVEVAAGRALSPRSVATLAGARRIAHHAALAKAASASAAPRILAAVGGTQPSQAATRSAPGSGQLSEAASANVVANRQTPSTEAGSAKTTSEAAHAKAQESITAAKSEEAHAKASEPHGRSEEAHGKTGEAHGKSEEAHGKSDEAHNSEETHGKSEEAHGKSDEAHKSEEAHGKGEEAHAKSEDAPGKSEEGHGKSEEAHSHG